MKLSNLLIFLLIGCGVLERKGSDDTTDRPTLQQVYSLYHTLNAKHQDGNGFIIPDDCDSLLFTSLNAVGRNEPINIEAAQISPGRWYSKPIHSGCERDISRDMLMGLIAYSLHFNRLDITENLWSYGSSHAWKMGNANGEFEKEARTVMNPGMIALLAQVIKHLGGESHAIQYTPQVYTAEKGFAGHLTLLHFYMLDKMDGKLGINELKALKALHELDSQSVLASYLYNKYNGGNQDQTVELLLNRYPNDRLPNGGDWCEQWIQIRIGTMHEQGFCPGTEWHGGDLLFNAALVLKDAA